MLKVSNIAMLKVSNIDSHAKGNAMLKVSNIDSHFCGDAYMYRFSQKVACLMKYGEVVRVTAAGGEN